MQRLFLVKTSKASLIANASNISEAYRRLSAVSTSVRRLTMATNVGEATEEASTEHEKKLAEVTEECKNAQEKIVSLEEELQKLKSAVDACQNVFLDL